MLGDRLPQIEPPRAQRLWRFVAIEAHFDLRLFGRDIRFGRKDESERLLDMSGDGVEGDNAGLYHIRHQIHTHPHPAPAAEGLELGARRQPLERDQGKARGERPAFVGLRFQLQRHRSRRHLVDMDRAAELGLGQLSAHFDHPPELPPLVTRCRPAPRIRRWRMPAAKRAK